MQMLGGAGGGASEHGQQRGLGVNRSNLSGAGRQPAARSRVTAIRASAV